MPIRFRCSYCSQLLGIARRKAGTNVRCPTCAGQVLVPNQDQVGAEAGADEASPFIFDRNDFDDLLQGGVVAPEPQEAVAANGGDPRQFPAVKPPSGAWGTHGEPAYRERSSQVKPALTNGKKPSSPSGILVTHGQLVLAGVLVFVALILAFGLGLAIGLMQHDPPKGEASLPAPQILS